jgi:hypothetical protein
MDQPERPTQTLGQMMAQLLRWIVVVFGVIFLGGAALSVCKGYDEEKTERARDPREIARKQRAIEAQRQKWEKECADQGLRFVGTTDGKVDCRK